jgi:hypothetical protein
MGGHIRTNKSAVAFFDWTLDSILINLNFPPGIPPVQQRSGKCPTGSGRTPANHGQPGCLVQVLTVPDLGIWKSSIHRRPEKAQYIVHL